MSLVKQLILGFIAGFLATLIFHQRLWYLFNQVGIIPPDRPGLLDPILPYGVPQSYRRRSGAACWARGLALVLGDSGTAYWMSWIVVGAVALTALAFFIVAPLKGEPIPALWPRFASGLLLNGAWGFGTALLLRLMAHLGHAASEPPPSPACLSLRGDRRTMPVREGPAQPAPPPGTERAPYPGEKARGAEIVLTTPTRRAIFIAGLVGAIVFGVLLVLIGLTR